MHMLYPELKTAIFPVPPIINPRHVKNKNRYLTANGVEPNQTTPARTV